MTAAPLAEVALRLERMGLSRDFTGASDALDALDAEVARATAAMSAPLDTTGREVT